MEETRCPSWKVVLRRHGNHHSPDGKFGFCLHQSQNQQRHYRKQCLLLVFEIEPLRYLPTMSLRRPDTGDQFQVISQDRGHSLIGPAQKLSVFYHSDEHKSHQPYQLNHFAYQIHQPIISLEIPELKSNSAIRRNSLPNLCATSF